MRFVKVAAAAAALSLSAAPVVAQSTSDTSMEAEGASAGRTALFVVLGLVAVIIGIVGIGGDDDSVSA
jgi:hypothetical protein